MLSKQNIVIHLDHQMCIFKYSQLKVDFFFFYCKVFMLFDAYIGLYTKFEIIIELIEK